jgi:endonuclease YncB( thermonuclease family)
MGNKLVSPKPQHRGLNSNSDEPITFIPPVTTGTVIKVYDGDTFTIAARIFDQPQLYKFTVRLNGIDAPELKTDNVNEKQAAIKAREALVSLILNKEVVLKNVKHEKYGRLLADVYVKSSMTNVSSWLLRKKLVVPYDGGTKSIPKDWLEYQSGNEKCTATTEAAEPQE